MQSIPWFLQRKADSIEDIILNKQSGITNNNRDFFWQNRMQEKYYILEAMESDRFDVLLCSCVFYLHMSLDYPESTHCAAVDVWLSVRCMWAVRDGSGGMLGYGPLCLLNSSGHSYSTASCHRSQWEHTLPIRYTKLYQTRTCKQQEYGNMGTPGNVLFTDKRHQDWFILPALLYFHPVALLT